ncbi:class I SAM-dependent methyltransferase [Streptomyces specialis]|uniref:class I SAM-dependent methyltransferase n=1 Tax=Streptomyces specialis TaxID=498367 RepID=UPI00073EBD2C|nr:class I SAM-dependent methyltransferase [Streptomyces specialis]
MSDETARRTSLDTAKLFNEVAEPYERFTRLLDRPGGEIDTWLSGHIGTGHRALDVGCGTGRWSTALATRYDEVLAIDAAPRMIEIAERERPRPNIRFRVRDAMTLTPREDGVFDVVLVFSCVMHVGDAGPLLAVLRRMVAPGGKLLIIEPERPPMWGDEGWQTDFAFGRARDLYEATGDVDAAVATLQAILSPSWLKISRISVPLTPDRFAEEYLRALPGAVVERGGDVFGIFMLSWRAPD